MDGFGKITWWGFTPALDFFDFDISSSFSDLDLNESTSREVHILLAGAGDCRHVLKTVARQYRHPPRKIHFYILESNLELYARHLLLLHIAVQSQCQMGLQEKTELFLELYGNILIRDQSAQFVESKATKFIKMVTDFDYLKKTMPLLDLSQMKFKERDMLEAIFKFWRNPDRKILDLPYCWDLRLRQYLGVRYDAIPNVFDWDFNMKLMERGAEIIGNRHYNHWRHKGVSFEIREGCYDVTNKTLASGMVFNMAGEKVARRGYWGDILVSPYITFGIESEEESFFKKSNKVHTQCSQDVSEFNVLSLFHELATNSKYSPPSTGTEPVQTATITELDEENETCEGPTVSEENDQSGDPYIPIENVAVTFLPLDGFADLLKKSKYNKRFDIVYIANSLVHNLTPDLSKIFADKAHIILETARFMIELKPEQCQQFVKKITGLAEACNCKLDAPCDGLKDSFASFKFQRPSS